MKQFFTLLAVILFAIEGYSQCISDDPNSPPCNGIISTDPDNPVNQERGDLINRFDWRIEEFKAYFPDAGYGTSGNPQYDLANPFWRKDKYLEHINFYRDVNILHIGKNPARLDFHPADGWELLHKHNGFEPNESTLLSAENNRHPYFILYNKYTGLVRVLLSWSRQETFNGNIATLGFVDLSSDANLEYSGLLSNYSGTAKALDQHTIVSQVSQVSQYAMPKCFMVWDFPKMSYDPCVCKNRSQIQLSFANLNEATTILEGRLIGTNVPLDGNQNPLVNRDDFLMSVYQDDFTINGGMLTYKNIENLNLAVKNARQTANPLLDIISAGLGAAFGAGGQAIDQVFQNSINKLLTNQIGGDKIAFLTAPEKFSVSFGFLGSAAKQFGSGLLGSPHSIPSYSVIEGELVLNGTIRRETGITAEGITLLNPGSLGSNHPNVSWSNYPLYNEALGVFAMLETPKVKYYFEEDEEGWTDEYDHLFQLDKNSIKYYFNPAAELNIEKTRIYAALVVHSDRCSSSRLTGHLNPVSSASGKTTFITDFYPLEVLPQVASYILGRGSAVCNPSSVSLRLQIFYEFKRNRYGKVIRNYEILDFATALVSTSARPRSTLRELPENVTVYGIINSGSVKTLRTSIGNFPITGNLTIKALNNITIAGHLQGLSSGMSISFNSW